MGGNNTFSSNKVTAFRWRTIEKIHGVKVLKIIDGKDKLPEEAHNSRMYIRLDNHDKFYQLRIYDSHHITRFELAYHREPALDPSGKPVLHYHVFSPPGFNHGPAHLATETMRNKFHKYFKGLDI